MPDSKGNETFLTLQKKDLYKYINRLQELYSLSEAIIKNNSRIEDVYEAFLSAAKRLLNANKAAILVFDKNGALKFESQSGLSKKYIAGIKHSLRLRLKHKPLLINNTRDNKYLLSSKKLLLKEGISAYGFFPLLGADKVFGKLAVYYNKPHKFTDEEMQLAQIISKQISSLLERREANIGILDALVDGITVQNKEGRVIFANKTASHALGYESFEEMLKNPTKWVSEYELKDKKGGVFNPLNLPGRRVLNGEIYAEELIQYRNLKGEESRWVNIKSQPIYDDEGKLKMVINIMHDVTERFELEKRKDEFISSASHELKTPLAVLKGFAQVMQKEQDTEKNKYYLGKMVGQIDRLTNLVEDLLDVSKIQSGKLSLQKEKFNIVKLIEETATDLQLINNHKIILQNNILKKQVKADKSRIGEVLNNLISNAIKFSPKSDKVIVSIKDKKKDLVVKVRDYGIGMSSKDMKSIFQPFFQANNRIRQSFGGLGLGLHISSQIIWRHGGKIWVSSRKGEGSTFSFSLPLA